MKNYVVLFLTFLVSITLHAEESERFITKIKLPSGQTAVVAEGDFEARSIGSFSVCLYEAASPGDETTFFTTGIILSREGTIEKVELADIDGDKKPEIIIILRSVGTGGYIFSHAISFDAKKLIDLVSVENLPPETEVLVALRKSWKR